MVLRWTIYSRGHILQFAFGLFAIAVVTLAVMRKSKDEDPTMCTSLLRHGRWIEERPENNLNTWQPVNCLMRRYDTSSTTKCLHGRTLYFIGDSTSRLLFWAVAAKLQDGNIDRTHVQSEKHTDTTYEAAGVRLEFLWDPYLNSSKSENILKSTFPSAIGSDFSKAEESKNTFGLVLSVGLWHARYLEKHYLFEYDAALGRLIPFLTPRASGNISDWLPPIIFQPPPFPAYGLLGPERAATLTEHRMTTLIKRLYYFEERFPIEIPWTNLLMTSDHPLQLLDSGIHVSPRVASQQADILLNRFCNMFLQGDILLPRTTCCVTPQSNSLPNWQSWVLITVLYLTHLQSMRLDVCSSRNNNKIQHAFAPSILAAAAIHCYFNDRTTFTDVSGKPVSPIAFVLIIILVMLTAFIHARVNVESPASRDSRIYPQDEFLSRSQTEEWKGWMQVVILLYHYFGVSKVLAFYRIVRVLVGSYLFLTGYGHSSYFIKTGDFSFQRVALVLCRLNVFTVLLSFMMNNTYDFYYFPGLSSFWFLVTYCTLYGKKTQLSRTKVLLARIIFSAAIVTTFIKYPLGRQIFLAWLEKIGGPVFNEHEFSFRISLDQYAPFLGMIVASLHSHFKANTLYDARNCVTSVLSRPPISKVLQCTSILTLMVYFMIAQLFSEKEEYNKWHSMISLPTILAYIWLRNQTSFLRQHHLPLFAWVGKRSLETFILQYHIWLAADTKGILHLGLFDLPNRGGTITLLSWRWWLDTAIATILFLWTSSLVADASDAICWTFIGSIKSSREKQDLIIIKPELRQSWFRVWALDLPGRNIVIRCAIMCLVVWVLNMSY